MVAGIPLIQVVGEIDHGSAPLLREAFGKVLSQPDRPPCLLVDLSECPYLDGAGLGVPASVRERLPEPGWLGVVEASGHILRLFAIVGLRPDSQFHLFPTRGDAETLILGPSLALAL
jgi:anti-anti-sigma factor